MGRNWDALARRLRAAFGEVALYRTDGEGDGTRCAQDAAAADDLLVGRELAFGGEAGGPAGEFGLHLEALLLDDAEVGVEGLLEVVVGGAHEGRVGELHRAEAVQGEQGEVRRRPASLPWMMRRGGPVVSRES